MNNTPAESGPPEVKTPEMRSIFLSFYYSGKDNGVSKSGFDSRVIQTPVDVRLTSAEDIKEIADAIARSEFQGGRKYVDLEIVVLGIDPLPI